MAEGPSNTDIESRDSVLAERPETPTLIGRCLWRIHVLKRVTFSLLSTAALPTPFIRSNTSDLVEGQGSMAITCEPETQNTIYRWSMNNQSLPDSARLQLSQDNRTLTVHSVTRKDTGPYECETQNPVSACRSDPFTLKVFYGPDTPSISTPGSSYPPGANLSLSCLAASNPPAQYSWLIKGRPQQYTQELLILNVSVHDSGSYTCHVHNSVTGLNRTTVRNITVSDSASAGAVAGIVTGVLAGLALTEVLGWFLLRRDSAGSAEASGSEINGQGHTPDVQLQARTVQTGVLAMGAVSWAVLAPLVMGYGDAGMGLLAHFHCPG
ncbi:cell adhesion molecule CEACAM1-like [Dasypus novemcinctus]|uniref:cell adhesion molecule CEACAM1-like n=1 Tax=Dasypus novemcinctus TaxID=9361 RepID=UPI0039C9BCB5